MTKDNLPATTTGSALAAQLDQALQSPTLQTGDVAFLKCAKGDWTYGADETEVDGESLWAVNPNSFCQGYIVWGDEEVLDEQMAQLGQPAPAVPAGGDAQVAFQMVCVDGADKGTTVLYKTSSLGGRKAVMALIKAVSAQATAGEDFVPVVALTNDSYKHKKYGKIYTPVFAVDHWTDGKGEEGEAQEAIEAPDAVEPDAVEPDAVEPEAEEPKRRRRSRRA